MKTITTFAPVFLPLVVILASRDMAAGDTVAVDPPLIACWNFDVENRGIGFDSSGNGNDAAMAGVTTTKRALGLFGDALNFSGQHRLQVPGKPDFARVKKIGFSAWVLPSSFQAYNEIFRKEDGDRRVLFSFQEHGGTLSLGLNIDGYVECDAPIRPDQILDGLWHHCAATFDGEVMRVYLDGKEIGLLQRSGVIDAGGSAPGCIGSSNGQECFQGSMDELRLYGGALTPGEVKRLYEQGLEPARQYREKRAQQILANKEKLRKLNITGATFAQMLSNARRSMVESGITLEEPLAGEIREILKLSFPEDYRDYASFTGLDVAHYLRSDDENLNETVMKKMLGRLTEYMPLTEYQWENQTE